MFKSEADLEKSVQSADLNALRCPSNERILLVKQTIIRDPKLSTAEAAILIATWSLWESDVSEDKVKDVICQHVNACFEDLYNNNTASDFRLCLPIVLGWEQYYSVIDSVKKKIAMHLTEKPEHIYIGVESVRFYAVPCEEKEYSNLKYAISRDDLDTRISDYLLVYSLESESLHKLIKDSMPVLSYYDNPVFQTCISSTLKMHMLSTLKRSEIPYWVFESINKFLEVNKIVPENLDAFVTKNFLSNIPIYCVTNVQLMLKVIKELGSILLDVGRCSYMDIAHFEEFKI